MREATHRTDTPRLLTLSYSVEEYALKNNTRPQCFQWSQARASILMAPSSIFGDLHRAFLLLDRWAIKRERVGNITRLMAKRLQMKHRVWTSSPVARRDSPPLAYAQITRIRRLCKIIWGFRLEVDVRAVSRVLKDQWHCGESAYRKCAFDEFGGNARHDWENGLPTYLPIYLCLY